MNNYNFCWMKFLLISLSFFVVQTLKAEEQNKAYFTPENILRFAQHLYEEGDYLRAAGEFERYLYSFDTYPENADSILFKIGNSYKKIGEYQKSTTFFEKIIELFPQSSLLSEACYQIAHNYFLMQKYEESIKSSDTYFSIIDSQQKKRKLVHLKTLDFLYQKKWDEAKVLIESLEKECGKDSLSFLLNEFAEKGRNLPRKKRFLAGFMSTVIPGSGKIYANRSLDGIVSFLTIATLGWRSYKSFRKDGKNSIQGWVYGTIGTFLYLGNIYGSVVAVNIYNREAEKKYFKEIEVKVNVYF